ncbi:phospholipase A2 inhibitor and Ly6/PLAUR domain-containing protein [Xenopus laevis]|uniref:Phospholipase A2 inhibitor and Ly6/PLAUR domain-containing protein n=2 Tax=Xenopus laevis TaxID=8355 RepID=A0A1L8FPT1_XENLA|nr:phospholipase A2 inhibitor and Ly6/PLAUR domain-containing protein [Xenopus laevis]OCT73604.1 hypothetical protein XELAEV_18036583mg [Xenopus laevis]
MRSLLRFIYILCVVAATGYSLSCQTCISSSDSPCQGTSETCQRDDVCRTLYILATAAGITVKEVKTISCAPRKGCDRHGSFRNDIAHVKLGTSCCDTDDCTPPKPTLPVNNPQLNGVICNTCTTITSNMCYSEDTMKCTGDEYMCASYYAQMSGGNETIKVAANGCATKSFCDFGRNSPHFEKDEFSIKFRVTCTNDKHQEL